MIVYDPGSYGVGFACRLRGSVFPRAFAPASLCTGLAVLLHWSFRYSPTTLDEIGAGDAEANVLGGFTFILGFLVVFRSQQAYSRWWEGGTLLQQLRGEWFNSYSCLIAFCNAAPEKREEVVHFQHQLVRLYSLLYGCALQQVATMDDKNFELFILEGFEEGSLAFLQGSHDRCEITLQWIQRGPARMRGVVGWQGSWLLNLFAELEFKAWWAAFRAEAEAREATACDEVFDALRREAVAGVATRLNLRNFRVLALACGERMLGPAWVSDFQAPLVAVVRPYPLRSLSGGRLLDAASQGDVEAVVSRLEEPLDPDTCDERGKAPMHGAAENGHLHVVQCLLEAGAKLGAGEWEPMHLAAKNGHAEVVGCLLAAGAQKDQGNAEWWTPMHVAAMHGHQEVVGCLLAAGADKDKIDNYGRTPLHMAAKNGLIVESDSKQILKIAPPILSRVFNELGNGIVNLNNARKITDFPIPFHL
ncbi:unnamed protein product, partial [Effrenium voratum]